MLNIYQINRYQNILFMLKFKLGQVPYHFTNNFFINNVNKYNIRETGNLEFILIEEY